MIAVKQGTVMQIEKPLINDCLHVSKVSRKFALATEIYNVAVLKFAIFLKKDLLFKSFYCLFCLETKFFSSYILEQTVPLSTASDGQQNLSNTLVKHFAFILEVCLQNFRCIHVDYLI